MYKSSLGCHLQTKAPDTTFTPWRVFIWRWVKSKVESQEVHFDFAFFLRQCCCMSLTRAVYATLKCSSAWKVFTENSFEFEARSVFFAKVLHQDKIRLAIHTLIKGLKRGSFCLVTKATCHQPYGLSLPCLLGERLVIMAIFNGINGCQRHAQMVHTGLVSLTMGVVSSLAVHTH